MQQPDYNTLTRLSVGLDTRMVYYRQAGIGQYILNLLREFASLENCPVDLIVYQSRKEARTPAEWLGWPYPYQNLWTPAHHRFEQLALPVELLRKPPVVFHSPDFIPPLRRFRFEKGRIVRIASVITIHDLAFKRFPHLLTGESARYYGQIEQAAASAERIIAVSASTARDIISELKVPAEKVKVVYEAANPIFRYLSPEELARLGAGDACGVVDKLAKAGISSEDGFWLFVSTIEPRKNLQTLLKAYRGFLGDQKGPKLVIAGREGWLFEDVYRLAGELGLKDHLVWLGGVSTEELLWLYNRASFLAMPSLYEGFGLPPLEALACGLPVLVADTSSLPEVVGEAGLKLPPEEVEAWRDALTACWQNREDLKQAALVKGPAQTARFSWQKAARETIEVYLEAAQQQS